MSDKHPIRNGIISSVVGGVMLKALSLFWAPATALWHLLATFLVTRLSVPVWAFGPGAVLVAAVARAARRSPSEPQLPRSAAAEMIDASAPRYLHAKVDPLEREVLTRLVKADGKSVTFNALVHATGVAKLRLQAELERLQSNNIVEALDDDLEGNADIYLTPRGRQYVIQLGLM
jgi:hypothetical protein